MICFLLFPVPGSAQPPTSSLEFHFQGMKIGVPLTRNYLAVTPVISLLGGEISYSEAAGVWALSLDQHLVQLAPERKLLLVDGKLLEAGDMPIAIPGGIAVSLHFLNHYILAPFGFHLEQGEGIYFIREGASFGEPILVHPIVADFGATTTLVLAFDEETRVVVQTNPDGEILVVFPKNSPRLDTSRRFSSPNILTIQSGPGQIEVRPAEGIGLLSSNILHKPERVVLELGKVSPTPIPKVTPPLSPARKRSRPLIVIDPGHGGNDTGAVSESGLTEKTLTMAVARLLISRLRSAGYSVRLTREKDENRTLTDRAALANRLEATLFISLHANSSMAHSVRGAETYYMSLDENASDAAAQNTAKLENASRREGKHPASGLDLILWDMAQSEVLNESAALALDIQLRLNALMGIRDRGVKQAPFVVLTGATMPAALVEIGFLSNAEEALKLESTTHQEELARAITLGIQDYLRSR